jgi:cell division protein FtsI/penicillin-binding protein 2
VVESKASVTAMERRVRALLALFSAGFLALAFRLFQLQVIRGPEMEHLAEMNRTQVIPLRAPRGLVMDRHGEVLLGNEPNFSLLYSAQSVSVEGQKERSRPNC